MAPISTVRGRITFWTALVVGLVAVVAAAALFGLSRRALVSDVRTTLTQNLDEAREVLDRGVATELNLLSLGIAIDPFDKTSQIAEDRCAPILESAYGDRRLSFEEFYFLLWVDDATYVAYDDCLQSADPIYEAMLACDATAIAAVGNPRLTFEEYRELQDGGAFTSALDDCFEDLVIADSGIESAARTCDPLIDSAFDGVDVLDESAVQVATDAFLTEYVECMRSNGVDDYPDLTATFENDGSVLSGVAGSAVLIPSLAAVRAGLERFGLGMAIGVPLLLLLLVALTWFVVGRALAPVEEIRSRVEQIGADELDRRVPIPATRDEVARLAETMNAMLDRLEESAERQRQFVSDASHELRSPLASIRTQLEVAIAHGHAADWPSVGTGVLAEEARMEALVDDLLALARLDERAGMRSERFDMTDLIVDVVDNLPPGTEVVVSEVQPVVIDADRAALRRVVRNLVGNARRHAALRVAVGATDRGDRVDIVVDDDGEGIAAEDREGVFQRFTRLESARSRDEGGAGLGLAVVRGIVIAHGGTIVIDDSPLGGARFIVSLPQRSGD